MLLGCMNLNYAPNKPISSSVLNVESCCIVAPCGKDLRDLDVVADEMIMKELSKEACKPIDARLPTDHNENNIFPYLLVNIGSGVSMIEVIGKGKFERIIGTHLGGGTILGLAWLLTGCTSYKEFLGLSQRGNNLSVDLTVGDIYGAPEGTDFLYHLKHGLPVSTTSASFGKVSSNKLSDYKAEDLAAALFNAFTYNVGQISYFASKLSGLKRIFFRGPYICGHAKTTDKISRSLKYWSKDHIQTTFLCREGFMGTLGAFWSYENMGINDVAAHEFMKEVLLSAPYMGGKGQPSPQEILLEKYIHQAPLLDNILGLLDNIMVDYAKNDETFSTGELEMLQHSNAELKAEIERLRQENFELKARLEELQQDPQTSLH